MLVDWLEYIRYLNPMLIDLNLDRVRSVAIDLKLLPFNIYTILVAGTNGKGSTCYLLEKILLHNNIKVGLYTSPHLLSYHERIRVCGQELSDDIHVKAMSMIEQARSNVALTYFEFITLSALYIFKQFQLEAVILEVGLGGRLDATNIVYPDISVITNIEIDHVDFLGSTRHTIAIEKSGVFRANRPAIVGELNRPAVIDKMAKINESILFVRDRDWDFKYCYNTWHFWVNYNKYRRYFVNLPIPNISLKSAAIVLSVLCWVPFLISRKSIHYNLKHVIVPGRFQIINYYPLIILDVGHNPNAAAYVVNRLSKVIVKSRVIRVVIGMLKSKDIHGTILYLSKLVDVWYCVNLITSLSSNIHEIFNSYDNFDAQYFDSITDAWKKVISDSSINDCILVFGSFYLVEPIMKLLFRKYDMKVNQYIY